MNTPDFRKITLKQLQEEVLKGDNCDFCVPTHKLEKDAFHTIDRKEISTHYRAYVHLFLDNLPYEIKNSLTSSQRISVIAFAVSMAKGGSAVIPEMEVEEGKKQDVIITGDSDWAACDKGLKRWEEYKKRYPVEV